MEFYKELTPTIVSVMLNLVEKYYDTTGDYSYHNKDHIAFMLYKYCGVQDRIINLVQRAAHRRSLITAILFHDAGYTTNDPCPETLACDIYKKSVVIPDKDVIALILSTHYSAAFNFEVPQRLKTAADILHDLDWAYFANEETFGVAHSLICNELRMTLDVSDESVQFHRNSFYKEVLDQINNNGGRLFSTNILIDNDEDGIKANSIAIKNIVRRLALTDKNYLDKDTELINKLKDTVKNEQKTGDC